MKTMLLSGLLVGCLASSDFGTRYQAARALERLGVFAAGALDAGCRSSDPEVRNRCAAVLNSLGITDRALEAIPAPEPVGEGN